MCKKQTSVSHSSTESEIISLDTGLRLDGLPALELCDLIVSVFGSISHVSDRAGQPVNAKNKSYYKSMLCRTLILFPQMFNPQVVKLYCTCQSVSRRCPSCSMDQGNLMEREISINQLILVSQETRTVLTASFLKTPKLRKWSMDQGNLMSETARTYRLGLYLKSRDRRLSRNIAKKSVITNSKQLEPKKSNDFFKDNYGNRNWNFVKVINKVLQRWRNYEKFQRSTFDTLARRKLIEDQKIIMELSGRLQELQNEVNCMNDSKDF